MPHFLPAEMVSPGSEAASQGLLETLLPVWEISLPMQLSKNIILRSTFLPHSADLLARPAYAWHPPRFSRTSPSTPLLLSWCTHVYGKPYGFRLSPSPSSILWTGTTWEISAWTPSLTYVRDLRLSIWNLMGAAPLIRSKKAAARHFQRSAAFLTCPCQPEMTHSKQGTSYLRIPVTLPRPAILATQRKSCIISKPVHRRR